MAGGLQLLEEDIQTLESVKTLAQLANADVQLSQDVSNLASVTASASASANSSWRRALQLLTQARSKLQQLAPANSSSSSQNPLKKSGTASDPVKSILSDLNTAYTLLKKVATDLAPLLTYTVSVNWSNDGTVRSSPGIGNKLIDCGGPAHTCHVAFLDYAGASFIFNGFDEPPKKYAPGSVRSPNGGTCTATKLTGVIGNAQSWSCSLRGGTQDVSMTVAWRALPSSP